MKYVKMQLYKKNGWNIKKLTAYLDRNGISHAIEYKGAPNEYIEVYQSAHITQLIIINNS